MTFRRAASSHPRGHKRRREHRVCAAWGKRIRTTTSGFSDSSTLQAADTLNRKRTAKSLTYEDPTQQSLMKMFSGHTVESEERNRQSNIPPDCGACSSDVYRLKKNTKPSLRNNHSCPRASWCQSPCLSPIEETSASWFVDII